MPTGSAPDGNAIPVPKENAELAMDAAACIGCGACVAACPNASAMLFTGAKVSQLALLPQGQPERYLRVRKMVAAMDDEGFGNCTNHGECEAACPKGIKLDVIARMNRDFLKASLMGAEESKGGGGGARPARSAGRRPTRRSAGLRRGSAGAVLAVGSPGEAAYCCCITRRASPSKAGWPRSGRSIGSTARSTTQGSRWSAATARSSSARSVSPSARWTVAAW